MIINRGQGGGKENLTDVLIEQDNLISELDTLVDSVNTVNDDVLINPGFPEDINKGKQFIDRFGEVVEGTYNGLKLPSLTNPGTAADLAEGKQLIDAEGNLVVGSKPEEIPVIGTFTISAIVDMDSALLKYPFVIGMTWGDFIESKFNPIKAYNVSGYDYFYGAVHTDSSGSGVYLYINAVSVAITTTHLNSSTSVKLTDVIQNNFQYGLSSLDLGPV